jgi:hypothetical protein
VTFDRDQIEARLALKLMASADMPEIALSALEAGLDGKAIRRLAILEHPTYFEVAEVLPRAMQELGLTQIPIEEAAVRVAKEIAKGILESGDESLWVRSDYAHQISELGTLYDDVYIAQSMGQSDEESRYWVTSILKGFVQ